MEAIKDYSILLFSRYPHGVRMVEYTFFLPSINVMVEVYANDISLLGSCDSSIQTRLELAHALVLFSEIL